MNRKEALDEAARCVLSDRNREYGNPEDNFKTTAQIWNAYLHARGLLPPDVNLATYDVSNLMIGLKLARMATSPTKVDHYVDTAGYAACSAECAGNEQQVG